VNYVDVYDYLANVALVARKCPSTVLRRAYVSAMRQWCNETKWLRTTVTGSTASGTQLYSLGDDTYLQIIGVHAVSLTDSGSNIIGLNPSDSAFWNPNLANGTPRWYGYVPEAQIALHPTPDAVYAMTVSLIVQPKSDETTQVPEALLAKYSTVFEAGALGYLLSLPGQPWTNPNEAAMQMRTFRSGISNGKAEVQRAYNQGSQRARPRAFVTGR
jgi:hypothetical protein